MDARIAARWFTWPGMLVFSPVPIATATLSLGLWRLLGRGSEAGPFICAIGLFVLAYTGIAISLWPIIVPHHYALWDAADGLRRSRPAASLPNDLSQG